MAYASKKIQLATMKTMLRNRSYWLYRTRTYKWEKTRHKRRRKQISEFQDRCEHITFSIIHDLIVDRL